MWFSKGIFSSFEKKVVRQSFDDSSSIKVGILGTGKIGTDLLVKVMRSKNLECVMFSGRNLSSQGMQYASSLGVPVSDKGIYAFMENEHDCQIVFDATSAAYHLEHCSIFEEQGIFAIDMTPSQIGECVVPAISLDEVRHHKNISMISCGGQSSIPIAYVLSTVIPKIDELSVSSVVSANSIGPGTLANIDEYYRNTAAGLKKYSGIENIQVDLSVDEVNTKTKMYNTLIAVADNIDVKALHKPINNMINKIRKYVPGYRLEQIRDYDGRGVEIIISVEGAGDYLPKYAGNLDIINCAAIAVAEEYALLNQNAVFERAASFM